MLEAANDKREVLVMQYTSMLKTWRNNTVVKTEGIFNQYNSHHLFHEIRLLNSILVKCENYTFIFCQP
jgi:hypothetical protein